MPWFRSQGGAARISAPHDSSPYLRPLFSPPGQVVAVRQLYARRTPAPVYFYPSVHLTDISVPRDGDLPLEARVSMCA